MSNTPHPLTGLLPQDNFSPDVQTLVLATDTIRETGALTQRDLAALRPRDRSDALGIAVVAFAVAALVTGLVTTVGLAVAAGIVLLACVTLVVLGLVFDEGGFWVGMMAIAVGILVLIAKVAAEGPAVALGVVLIGLVSAGLAQAAHVAWHRGAVRRRGLERLVPLLADVARYHRVLSALNVSEQLMAASGTRPDAKAREEVLRGLRQTREQLLVALRTERVLRKHRDLLDGLAALPIAELGSFEAVRIADVGNDYRRLAEDTVSLAADLERTVRAMRDGSA